MDLSLGGRNGLHRLALEITKTKCSPGRILFMLISSNTKWNLMTDRGLDIGFRCILVEGISP